MLSRFLSSRIGGQNTSRIPSNSDEQWHWSSRNKTIVTVLPFLVGALVTMSGTHFALLVVNGLTIAYSAFSESLA